MTRFERDLADAVRPREAAVLDEDGVAPHVLRTRRWERTSRGLYVLAGIRRSAAQRIVAAAALLPPDGVIGGWAAAHVHGVDLLDGLGRRGEELPVDVLLPPGLHRQHLPGVRYRRATFARGERVEVEGLPVTSRARTAVDLACAASSTTEATVLLDLLVAAGLRPEELEAVALRGRRGAVQAREAITLTRGGSLSPGETRLRLLYLEQAPDARIHLNPTLTARDGRFVAMPDLFDEDAGLALEYDGATWEGERSAGHRDPEQHREDNVREEAMERLGVLVVRAGAGDLGAHRVQTAYRVRRARLDGLGRNRLRDRWVLRPRVER